jgi:3-oxoadipate enol-lactonase
MIGHEKFGTGRRTVIVLNDWLSDTSSWDGARRYLDTESFTWVFADLRGYGRSRTVAGRFDLNEATADVLALAQSLDVARFSIVGHSMSCLVALQLGQRAAERVERAVVITPPPPTGFGPEGAGLVAALTALARADDAGRLEMLRGMWGDRLSEQWIRFKLAEWRSSATDEAAAAYALMFARDGLPEPTVRVTAPLLAITGEEDSEPMRRAGVAAYLAPLSERLEVVPIATSGHYPMLEAPPLLATIVQRFLLQGPAAG